MHYRELYRSSKELSNDGELIRRFLGIPIKRSLKSHCYESSADLMNVLVKDTKPLLAWCLVLNKRCFQSIKSGVAEISGYLVSDSDTQTIDRATVEFVCQKLRLSSGRKILGGYSSDSNSGTVNYML